jgi:hypothetical protein
MRYQNSHPPWFFSNLIEPKGSTLSAKNLFRSIHAERTWPIEEQGDCSKKRPAFARHPALKTTFILVVVGTAPEELVM